MAKRVKKVTKGNPLAINKSPAPHDTVVTN
jgi:hypothetical protein